MLCYALFCPTQIAHARENTTSDRFFIATDRVVKRSIDYFDSDCFNSEKNETKLIRMDQVLHNRLSWQLIYFYFLKKTL
jgi:hypothetical protein